MLFSFYVMGVLLHTFLSTMLYSAHGEQKEVVDALDSCE